MEDVAAAAGVSAATAYNHFPTKHAIVAHVFWPVVRPLLVQAEHDIAVRRPVVPALKDQVIGLVRVSSRYRTLTGAFWAAVEEYSLRVGGPPGDDDVGDPRVIAPATTSLRLLIAYGQESGELRCYPPPREMAATMVNLLLMRAVNYPTEPPADLAELLLTVMFGTLKPELLTADPIAERPFRDLR